MNSQHFKRIFEFLTLCRIKYKNITKNPVKEISTFNISLYGNTVEYIASIFPTNKYDNNSINNKKDFDLNIFLSIIHLLSYLSK